MKPTGFSLAPAFFAQPCYASVAEDVSEIVIRAREGGVAGTTALPELQSAARSDLAAENELGALAEDGVAKPSGPDAALKLWRHAAAAGQRRCDAQPRRPAGLAGET